MGADRRAPHEGWRVPRANSVIITPWVSWPVVRRGRYRQREAERWTEQ